MESEEKLIVTMRITRWGLRPVGSYETDDDGAWGDCDGSLGDCGDGSCGLTISSASASNAPTAPTGTYRPYRPYRPYSYRSASIGSSRDALKAGPSPTTMPTPAPNPLPRAKD